METKKDEVDPQTTLNNISRRVITESMIIKNNRFESNIITTHDGIHIRFYFNRKAIVNNNNTIRFPTTTTTTT